ncbi:hypothetical protein QTJ16_005260 [Diplocarpon rosae]|uniref:holo-[acyl-carrier-protein] synthase n=1 Tax=Diplocarpon rosae TaxID=946125 RepID=A0AAD9SZD7_9HELO|nr:hypothetical protein QTJ16_005260 [Diplocarpon rosae]
MGKPFYRASPSSTPALAPASNLSSVPSPSSPPARAGAQNPQLSFNVSHQAGLVSLIGAVGFSRPVDVGTDIVCVSERAAHDDAYIAAQGFFAWIDMHADVFSTPELSSMKLGPLALEHLLEALVPGRRNTRIGGYGLDAISRCQRPGDVLRLPVSYDGDGFGDGRVTSTRHDSIAIKGSEVLALKKRRFYAYWCLREAYVKMTGEALAAPWLKELEISGVRAPLPAPGPGSAHPPCTAAAAASSRRPPDREDADLHEGEVVRNFKILLRDHQVADVEMELAALGREYMISAAVRGMRGEVEMGKWIRVELDEVVGLAEERGGYSAK